MADLNDLARAITVQRSNFPSLGDEESTVQRWCQSTLDTLHPIGDELIKMGRDLVCLIKSKDVLRGVAIDRLAQDTGESAVSIFRGCILVRQLYAHSDDPMIAEKLRLLLGKIEANLMEIGKESEEER